MKLAFMNDIHIRSTAPIGRKDNYVEAIFRKIDQMVDYANANDAQIIFGGDVFDTATVPTWLLNRTILHLRRANRQIYTIAGNHDLPFHSWDRVRDSSICTLHETGAIRLFESKGEFMAGSGNDVVWTSFCSFGLIPPTGLPQDGIFKILVVHEPVFEKVVPFYMAEALNIEQLEAKYPDYDLIVAGDIHERAIRSKAIVTGSMMRSTRAQKEFRPGFVVFDTETRTSEVIYFNIEEDVWIDDLVSHTKELEGFSEGLEELTSALVARGDRLDYKDTVCQLCADRPELKQKFLEVINDHQK